MKITRNPCFEKKVVVSEWWLSWQSPCSVSMGMSDSTHAKTKQSSNKMWHKFIAPDTGRSQELAGQPVLPTSELWGQWETWSQTNQNKTTANLKNKKWRDRWHTTSTSSLHMHAHVCLCALNHMCVKCMHIHIINTHTHTFIFKTLTGKILRCDLNCNFSYTRLYSFPTMLEEN